MAMERESMHKWWCGMADNTDRSICIIWRWKNKLLEAEGDVSKTGMPPKMGAPDLQDHKRMSTEWCDSHDKTSVLCTKFLADPDKKHRKKRNIKLGEL